MATRFYLSNVAAGYTPATWKGTWGNTDQAITRKLSTTQAGANTFHTVVDNNVTNPWDVAAIRFVSDPLTGTTVSGSDTLNWVQGIVESTTSMNAFFKVHVWVTTGNTDTVRGTLLSNNIGVTEFQDVSIAPRGQTEGNKTMTSVAITTGDRIVVEMGFDAQNAVSTVRTASFWIGGTGTDLVNNSTSVTTNPGWFEFSTALTTSSTGGGGVARWYFANAAATYTPTSWLGAWDKTTGAITALLSPTPTGANTTIALSETSTTNLFDVALARFVSEPLLASTITTADSFQWIFGAVEGLASSNDFPHVHIWISQGNSATPRATLLTDNIGALEWSTTAQASPNFYSNTAAPSVSVSAGDRLIIEIGFQGKNTSATSNTGTMYYGGTGNPMQPQSTAVTTEVGWFDFSASLGQSTSFAGSKTQTATARIAVNKTLTQGALARIATNRTLTQSATARIQRNLTKTQSATARVANNKTITQSSTARIANSKTLTQGAVARISVSRTLTQGATSRIANNLTKTQTATARITQGVNLTKTQTATARIANTRSLTQTATARIQRVVTKTQSATARIVQPRQLTQSSIARISNSRSLTQGATARITKTVTKTQGATARIATNRTLTQTATARIFQTFIGTKTQTATARIAVKLTLTQSARARISSSFTKTQGATARIANSRTKTQSATAYVYQTFIGTKTQTATARIQMNLTKTQTATATIIQNANYTPIAAIVQSGTNKSNVDSQTNLAEVETNGTIKSVDTPTNLSDVESKSNNTTVESPTNETTVN